MKRLLVLVAVLAALAPPAQAGWLFGRRCRGGNCQYVPARRYAAPAARPAQKPPEPQAAAAVERPVRFEPALPQELASGASRLEPALP